jgi:hypothetical protein
MDIMAMFCSKWWRRPVFQRGPVPNSFQITIEHLWCVIIMVFFVLFQVVEEASVPKSSCSKLLLNPHRASVVCGYDGLVLFQVVEEACVPKRSCSKLLSNHHPAHVVCGWNDLVLFLILVI